MGVSVLPKLASDAARATWAPSLSEQRGHPLPSEVHAIGDTWSRITTGRLQLTPHRAAQKL